SILPCDVRAAQPRRLSTLKHARKSECRGDRSDGYRNSTSCRSLIEGYESFAVDPGTQRGIVQSKISTFGFPMRDSSDFKILLSSPSPNSQRNSVVFPSIVIRSARISSFVFLCG